MKRMNQTPLSTWKRKGALLLGSVFLLSITSFAQEKKEKEMPDDIDLAKGVETYSTPEFKLELLKSSQTVAALKSNNDADFDYTPGERLDERKANGFYHLGDLNLRLKKEGDAAYTSYSTAKDRHNIKPISTNLENVLSVADLTPTLPEGFPLEAKRFWQKQGEDVVLRFELKNNGSSAIEIGALGIPVIFNNNIAGKSLDEAHAENVFFDPYIGMDAGYLQVIRLHGKGNPLVVMPWKNAQFEAYRPLLDDPTRRGITFEGFHEWMIHSKAYADNEWKDAEQWNTPSSKILQPGESYEFGLEFTLAPSVREIEKTLVAKKRPVAFGVPGYVLPMDVDGKLFLSSQSKVKSIQSEPLYALEVEKESKTPNGWLNYSVKGKTWGRARLTIHYEDGSVQTINYKVIKPESEVIADNGHFLTTEQWFDAKQDVFHRAPSVITYDYEKKEKVVNDSRAWICGLSDEGGAGAWLNAIMKQLVAPDPAEIKKMEDFVQQTVWGGLQYTDGKYQYGVKKSMYYYEPDSVPAGTYPEGINYNTWAAWKKEHSDSPERSYNYPHVAAAHWAMYRLNRYYDGLVTQQDWNWYLANAYHTAMAMVEHAPYYAQFGQMEGSVFLLILHDLKKEGKTEMANKLEAEMRKRAEHWASLNYPFGSEMPWDSTGQEEVYMWSRYFGFSDKALITLNAILAYMPTVPHWAYNGNARRYWDFLYGGKLSRVERMIHHYGSELNAIPVMNEYYLHPDDLYLLRVGYGGILGGIANITEDGFAPCAFHSFPSTLKNDGISGDYGSGFYGYAVNSVAVITNDEDFGWLSFGGNTSTKGKWVTTTLTTAAKNKVFMAPLKLTIALDAGAITTVAYNTKTGEVQITLAAANAYTPNAFVNVEGAYSIENCSPESNGTYKVALSNSSKILTLIAE